MKVGSLFSGIGGIEIGMENAGFTTEWFVENEKYAQAVLRKQFPQAVIYDDVTQIDWRTVPEIDILTGGFPCQDISNAGKRAGITGSRSSLWTYFLQAISVLRPRFVIAENVAALTQRGLDTVLCDLASVGYDAEWHCIPASAVGAPHRRDRIFIISYRHDCGHFHGQDEEQSAEAGKSAQREFESVCSNVPDTYIRGWSKGCEQQHYKDGEWKICSSKQYNKHKIRSESWTGSSPIGWWAVEPDVGRVADGIPKRMDRIKCLGNAVVPQVAEVIGKAIKELTFKVR